MRTNSQSSGTYVNNDYTNVMKSIKITSKQKTKNLFSKRIGRKHRLTKPVLNKIMTTNKYHVKYNFVGPLKEKVIYLVNLNHYRK